MIYRVHLDIKDMRHKLHEFAVTSYISNELIIWVEADDPDQVCVEVVSKIQSTILKELSTMKLKANLSKILDSIRFLTIRQSTRRGI